MKGSPVRVRLSAHNHKKDTSKHALRCVFLYIPRKRLFEIKRQDKHAHGGAVDALRENKLRGVGEVGSVLVEHIAQAEAEFQFGDKFEERHVEVATQTCFEHEIKGFRTQFRLLVAHEVVHWLHAGDDIGAEVIEALSAELKVHRYADVARLHVLRLFFAVAQIPKSDVLAAEVKRRNDAQPHVIAHFPFPQHTHAETKILSVGCCHPLVARLRVDVSVVVEPQPLVVQAYKETVVEAPLINERFVLHAPTLRLYRAERTEQNCY